MGLHSSIGRALQRLLRGHGFESRWSSQIFFWFICNRPLALRGHMTNASFKRWLGILLMTKIDRAHKNYVTPEIWEETHLREIFYGTLIFNKVVLVLAAMAARTTFCSYLVKHLIVTLRCAVNITISSFQQFSWS